MAAPDMAERKAALASGNALPPSKPGGPPRFPIRNAGQLADAIRAVGRVRPNTPAARNKVRKYIIGEAAKIGLSSKIPDSWNSDGSLKAGATS
jgi:hypothetical protein